MLPPNAVSIATAATKRPEPMRKPGSMRLAFALRVMPAVRRHVSARAHGSGLVMLRKGDKRRGGREGEGKRERGREAALRTHKEGGEESVQFFPSLLNSSPRRAPTDADGATLAEAPLTRLCCSPRKGRMKRVETGSVSLCIDSCSHSCLSFFSSMSFL